MIKVFSIGNTNVTKIEIEDKEDICIVVSVNPEMEKQTKMNCSKTIYFKFNKTMPLKINYTDPMRIGADRVAFALFALFEKIYPAYLIDAGTFITVDFFDGKTLYPMATIPGFQLQLKTLKKAFNLKSLIPKPPVTTFPKSPEEALYNGIWQNTLLGIKELLKKPHEILITGGDATIVKSFLKRGVIILNAVHIGAFMAYKKGII